MYKIFSLALLLTNLTLFRCNHLEKPFDILTETSQCTIVVDLGGYADVETASAAVDKIDWFDENQADDAICTQALAALELRHYLAALVSLPESRIPVVDDDVPVQGTIVFIGQPQPKTPYAEWAKKLKRRWKKVKSDSREGFRLDSFSSELQNGLVLSGRTRVGTLYAVYELLSRLGVEWYGPGRAEEFTPKLQRISTPAISEYVEPAMEIRGFWIEPGKVAGGDSAWIGKPYNRGNSAFYRWMGRNRLNYFWHKESRFAELKQRGVQLNCGGHDYYIKLLDPDAPYPYNYRDFAGDEGKSADPYKPSPEYRGDADSNGVLTYSEAHPEWYGLTKDHQRFFPRQRFGTNYCASKADGVAEFCKNVISMLKDGEWRNADIYDYWPLDAGNWCQCDDCRALGNDTDKLLHVLYQIRKAVKAAYQFKQLNRDVRVFSLAYAQTLTPPTKRLPRDFDYAGTALFIYPIERCYNHSMFDTTCTEVNVPLCQAIGNWFAKDCPYKGKLYLGEYYNISRFRDLPLVFTTVMRLDIPRYYLLGIRGMNYMHTRTSHLGVQTLLNYEFAQQTRKPWVPVDTLVAGYFSHRYAGAAEEMQDYYEKIEEVFANVKAWRYELCDRINRMARGEDRGPLMPLKTFHDHFSIEEHFLDRNDGVDWERSYQLIHDARHVLDAALEKELRDVVLDRIIEDEYQLRYAEMTIQLYDHVIRVLTLGDEEPEMREEAVIRLREVARNLAQYEIHSPALGMTNGLEATGIGEAVELLLGKFGQERTGQYRRAYD